MAIFRKMYGSRSRLVCAISEMHLKMLQWDYDDGLLERKIKKALGHK